jgi:hypothetical protein
MRSITHLCWCNWRAFWKEKPAGVSPRGSCSCTKIPRLTRHLQPGRNWPTWVSSFLITHPILRIWPRRTTTCSLFFLFFLFYLFFPKHLHAFRYTQCRGRINIWKFTAFFAWLSDVIKGKEIAGRVVTIQTRYVWLINYYYHYRKKCIINEFDISFR